MKKRFLLTASVVFLITPGLYAFQGKPAKADSSFPYKNLQEVMDGTKLLAPEKDRSIKILDNAHLFIEEKIKRSESEREKYWKRDLSSPAAYERSVEPNRGRFMKAIGLEDKTQPLQSFKLQFREEHPAVAMEKVHGEQDPEVIAETAAYKVYQVRWPVLNRVYGEGLLIQPKSKPIANVVAIPDADQTPEQLAGLAQGIDGESQYARRLAENGYQVLIPTIVSRKLIFPKTPNQQTHREWIYRQAFHMGRHIIGYEVQKILSAIDWFRKRDESVKTAVAGYHEGGLLALYAAAADKRIDAAWVSGYFNSRQKVWDEPIYRNVHGLLNEFGDAEIAALIAPRALVVEHSSIPEYVEQSVAAGDPPQNVSVWNFTGYKGTLRTPEGASAYGEYQRIERLTRPGFVPGGFFSGRNHEPLTFGSQRSLERLSELLGGPKALRIGQELPADKRTNFNPEEREIAQIKEMEDHVQWLMRDSDYERNRIFLYAIMPEFEKRTWSTKPHHPPPLARSLR